MGMAWPHLVEAREQHYKTGLDMEPSGQEKEGVGGGRGGGDKKTPGNLTLRQTSSKRGSAGNNWRRLLRTGDVGEKLCMSFGLGGANSLSK